jgi:hypothetical protein
MGEMIGIAKQATEAGKQRILKALSFVPDEKLTWSPSETAKSALRVAAHAGVSNGMFASILSGQKPSAGSMAEVFAAMDTAEKAITTREAAIKSVEESSSAIVAALDKMTPELVGSTVEMPFGSFPMAFFMTLPGSHMDAHAAQIDYIQTIWGDLDPHMM